MFDKKAARGLPASVMLIDDDAFMLLLMADMLTDIGVPTVIQIESARTALQQLQLQCPAMLICDLRMPDMDGIEFLDKVAHLGYSGGVILYSGVGAGVMRAAEKLALARGLKVLGTFEKPVDRTNLLHAMTTDL